MREEQLADGGKQLAEKISVELRSLFLSLTAFRLLPTELPWKRSHHFTA